MLVYFFPNLRTGLILSLLFTEFARELVGKISVLALSGGSLRNEPPLPKVIFFPQQRQHAWLITINYLSSLSTITLLGR